MVKAEGASLHLADGRKLIDGISSWWACLHGHCHPTISKAIGQQAASLDHVLFAGCSHEPAAKLAEELVTLAKPLASNQEFQPGPLTRCFFSDNGSTAIEVALKAAYQAHRRSGQPSRTTFIALEGGFHGDTFGAMSASDPVPFFEEFDAFLFHVVRVPPEEEALAEAFKDLEGRVAAFIGEPIVQGAHGMAMHSPEFLKSVRRLCTENGAFWIADEVMTGFGRTGKTFACEHAGVQPDFLCLSKGLTGGTMPLSATLTTENVFSAFLADDRSKSFFHGHTYTANPIGCAAARASLKVFEEENTPQKLDQVGRRIEQRLSSLRDDERVLDIRRIGGIVAIELSCAEDGYLAAKGEHLRTACRQLQHVLLRPLGNVLYALPHSCLNDSECDLVADALIEVIDVAARLESS